MRLMMGPRNRRDHPRNVAAQRQRQHVDLHVVSDLPVAPIEFSRQRKPRSEPPVSTIFVATLRLVANSGERRTYLHLVLGVVGDGDDHSTNEFEIDPQRVAMLLEESRFGDIFLLWPRQG